MGGDTGMKRQTQDHILDPVGHGTIMDAVYGLPPVAIEVGADRREILSGKDLTILEMAINIVTGCAKDNRIDPDHIVLFRMAYA